MTNNEKPSKDQLLAYSVKIINRGDRFTSVMNYLDRNCDDENLKQEILKTIDEMQSKGEIGPKAMNEPKIGLSQAMGLLFLVGGIAMTIFLWDSGFVSTVFVILIGIGALGLSGAMK